jgi:cytochrome c5
MEKTTQRRSNRLQLVVYIALPVAFIAAIAMSFDNKRKVSAEEIKQTALLNTSEKKNTNDERTEADKIREQESVAAFKEAYRVFMHPRCMNCHPSGDIPLQGDDSHLHAQGVKRGKDGKGLYALKCKNCHQDTHVAGINMPPGSPGWHLPPANLKMVFEGKTPRQLAMHFKDPKFTGFKTLDKMIEHVEHEPLVLNSWTYGTPPPLTHAEFVAKVKEWIAKGAAIPQ